MNSYRHRKFDAEDIERKSNLALERHPDFFNTPEHKKKIREVVKIVKEAFGVSYVYVNHRDNNWDPYTAVKPKGSSTLVYQTVKDIRNKYLKPLNKLGVVITESKTGDPVIHRIV